MASDEEFSKLGMPFVEFNIVGCEPAQKVKSFFIALKLMAGQTYQQFDIARLGDQLTLPFRIGEVIELLGLVFFFTKLVFHDAVMITMSAANQFELLRLAG